MESGFPCKGRNARLFQDKQQGAIVVCTDFSFFSFLPLSSLARGAARAKKGKRSKTRQEEGKESPGVLRPHCPLHSPCYLSRLSDFAMVSRGSDGRESRVNEESSL